MATAAERNKVLGIVMRAKDQFSPALRAAAVAVRAFRNVTLGAFRTMAGAARLAGRAFLALTNPLNLLRAFMLGLPFAFVFRSFQRLVDEMDEIAKQAQALHVPAQALRELGFVAEITGTDMDVLIKSMQRVTRAVFEAADGTKTYREVFEKLNLNVAELRGLDPVDQFTRVAGALAAMEDNTSRLGIAFELFGQRNAEVLRLIGESGDVVAELREEFRELSVVLGLDELALFEEFQDSQTRLNVAFKALKIVLALEVLPTLTELIDRVKDFLVNRRDDVRRWAANTVAGFRFAAGAISAFVELLRDASAGEADVFGRVLVEVGELALDVVREAVIAALRILKNVVDATVIPIGKAMLSAGQQVGLRLVAGVGNALLNLPVTMLQAVLKGISAVRDAIPNLQGAVVGAFFEGGALLRELQGNVAVLIGKFAGGVATGEFDFLGPLVKAAEARIRPAGELLGEAIQEAIKVAAREIDQSGQAFKDAFAGMRDAIAEFRAELAGIDSPAVTVFLLKLELLEIEYQAAAASAELAADAVRSFNREAGAGAGQLGPSEEDLQATRDLLAEAEILRAQGREREILALQHQFEQEVRAKQEAIQQIQGAEDAFIQWRLAREQELQRDLLELQGGFLDGARAALQEWLDAASNQFEAGKAAMQSFLGEIERGAAALLDNLVTGAQSATEAWKDFGRAVLLELGRIEARALAIDITRALFGKREEDKEETKGGGSFLGGIFGAILGALFAKGGVTRGGLIPLLAFQSGGITPGGGGIVDRPTLALIGEGRRREAVIPLPDNRGVRAVITEPAQPAAGETHVTFEIHAVDTRGFRQLLADEQATIEAMIRRAMAVKRDFRDTIKRIV